MKHRPLHVLVLDHAPASRTLLHTLLAAQGHTVFEAPDGNTALALLKSAPAVDLLLLELSLPDVDGFTVIREFRALKSSIAILVVSECDEEDVKVDALDLGADDYLTKPFGAQELFARIRVSLRHRGAASQILKAGDLTINVSDRTAWLAEEKLHLSPTEYNLLMLLMRNSGEALTNAQIGRMVWGEDTSPQSVRVYVRSLRQKLHDHIKHPQYILTRPKIGYQFGQEVEDLSREEMKSKRTLKLGNMELFMEKDNYQLLINGFPHYIGSTELSILEILLRHKGSAVSKEVIADSIGHGYSKVHHKSIEVYIHRLRRSLKEWGAEVAINTVKGTGYLINASLDKTAVAIARY